MLGQVLMLMLVALLPLGHTMALIYNVICEFIYDFSGLLPNFERERGQKLNLIEIEIMQPSSDRTRAGWVAGG